jgi:hypothetical protein
VHALPHTRHGDEQGRERQLASVCAAEVQYHARQRLALALVVRYGEGELEQRLLHLESHRRTAVQWHSTAAATPTPVDHRVHRR